MRRLYRVGDGGEGVQEDRRRENQIMSPIASLCSSLQSLYSLDGKIFPKCLKSVYPTQQKLEV